ncbi:MAG: flagellar protein FliT [Thiohalospira sp.]
MTKAAPDSGVVELRQTVTELTTAMRTAAEAGEWTEVAELEASRRPHLYALFEGEFPDTDPEAARDLIQWIRDEDAAIMEKGEVVRGRFLEEMQYGAEADRAIRAYRNNQRGRR